MNERPPLNKDLDYGIFLNFYWLKEELTDFCRQEALQSTGGKIELTDRIATYLMSGEKTKRISCKVQKPASLGIITEDSVVEPSFVCSETHRAFFLQAIGKTFSFNVAFQKWLKVNTGKTYKEAIVAYYQILDEKKKGTTIIDRQFEYNTYIRAFFTDNEGRALKEAIQCWKYKKSLQGNNRYEQSDLRALVEEG